MKHKHNGSAHIILIGILVILIGGALTYIFLKNLNQAKPSTSISQNTQPAEEMSNEQQRNYIEFEEWKVRFSSDTTYTLKLNSNKTAYFISIQELAKTCVTPDTPWLGIIQRFDNPNEKQTIGPNAGKTMNQIFGSKGETINGSLYYFDATTQFCTRNTSNPEIDQAAKKLEAEIKSLEAY